MIPDPPAIHITTHAVERAKQRLPALMLASMQSGEDVRSWLRRLARQGLEKRAPHSLGGSDVSELDACGVVFRVAAAGKGYTVLSVWSLASTRRMRKMTDVRKLTRDPRDRWKRSRRRR